MRANMVAFTMAAMFLAVAAIVGLVALREVIQAIVSGF